MSDLVVTVRQISNYPATTAASSGDNLLMQAGGPGAPYISINAADLVASALQGGPAMGLGMAPPGNADGGLFTGTITVPTDGAIAWNAYLNNGDWRLLNAGQAASIGWDQTSGLDFAVSTGGSAGQELTWVSMLRLDNAGNLGLPYGTIGVARDPSANNEVVTLNYLANNTVSTFNNRNGAVQLNAQDVYNALKLCDPIATQPWVQQAINNSIQNLLYTCPFVNTWNGRKGSVYLMLSDITTVFYQSGQQPISPTPAAGSNDDSIATTRWVTEIGGFLPLGGGTINPGPLVINKPDAPGVTIKPIGLFDPLPTGAQAQLYCWANLGYGHGGEFFNPTFSGQFGCTVYDSMDESAVGLLGQVDFAGRGGVGQHSALQAYANRYNIIAQPTTTVATTLAAPSSVLTITDVASFQYDSQAILINGNGYVQVAHSGTSGQGTITVDRNIPVSDGTAGNVVTGQNNPQLWGLNIHVNDDASNTGVTSSKQTNFMLGCELDFNCSGADDAGQLLYGVPSGVRQMITLIGMGGTPGNPAEIADGIALGPGYGATISWKRGFRMGGAFSQAAFDARGATQQAGACAIWLADHQTIAFTTAGQAGAKLSGAGNDITLTGTGIIYSVAVADAHSMAFGWNGTWLMFYSDGTFQGYVPFATPNGQVPFFGLTNAVDDAAAASAGVPVSGLYRNGSAVMQRIT